MKITFDKYYEKKVTKDFTVDDPMEPTGIRMLKVPKCLHLELHEWKDLNNELYRYGKTGLRGYSVEDAVNKILIDGRDVFDQELTKLRQTKAKVDELTTS